MDKFEAIKFRYDQARAMGSTSTAVQDIGQLLNELNRRQAALDAAEQRAAEAEGQLAECKDKFQVVLTVEWVDTFSGWMKCPWCRNVMDEGHKPNCHRQAAAKSLEEHSPHEHG